MLLVIIEVLIIGTTMCSLRLEFVVIDIDLEAIFILPFNYVYVLVHCCVIVVEDRYCETMTNVPLRD